MTLHVRPRSTLALATMLFVAFVALGALVRYLSEPAQATGIPTSDPLFYGGLLTDASGKPLSGDRSVAIKLWDAEKGGTKKCSVAAKKASLVQGRFRIALGKACVTAMHDEPDLWVEVIVDGASLGRSKVGAVPYAVETPGSVDRDCPPGYVRDSSTSKITLCKRGDDEMVKVGSFWVDRYESSLVDASTYAGGKCNGEGKQYGTVENVDDYPRRSGNDFPDTGDFSVPVYACSIHNRKPSASMSWFQAALACELSGKQLCTNYQWQMAALGTPDDRSSCNIGGSRRERTGQRGDCSSVWGARDMVGNLWEMINWWAMSGRPWQTGDEDNATPWPKDYGDGRDKTFGINGRAWHRQAWVKGVPAAARRGGSWTEDDATEAGVFAVSLDSSPADQVNIVGARCCRM